MEYIAALHSLCTLRRSFLAEARWHAGYISQLSVVKALLYVEALCLGFDMFVAYIDFRRQFYSRAISSVIIVKAPDRGYGPIDRDFLGDIIKKVILDGSDFDDDRS